MCCVVLYCYVAGSYPVFLMKWSAALPRFRENIGIWKCTLNYIILSHKYCCKYLFHPSPLQTYGKHVWLNLACFSGCGLNMSFPETFQFVYWFAFPCSSLLLKGNGWIMLTKFSIGLINSIFLCPGVGTARNWLLNGKGLRRTWRAKWNLAMWIVMLRRYILIFLWLYF
jgi:hypothetical protein